jgi:hypothetical protein
LTAVGSVAFQFIVHARLGTDIFQVATSWITAYFALTMCTNVLCSGNRFLFWKFPHGLTRCTCAGAIAWRIFNAGKPLKDARRTLWPVVFIIIESSALYAFGVITVLACFLSGSNAQYPAVDAIVPLVVSRSPHIPLMMHAVKLNIPLLFLPGHRLLSDRAADPFPCQLDG